MQFLGFSRLMKTRLSIVGSTLALTGLLVGGVIFSQSFLKNSQDVRSDASSSSVEEPFPQNQTLGDLNVYIVTYLPEDPDKPGFLDPNETGTGEPIQVMSDRLKGFNEEAIEKLTKSTIYKGYDNPTGTPSISYKIFGYSPEYREKMPRGFILKPAENIYRPNYMQILEREQVCDLVDNQGVDQIWIWGYHHGDIEPTESNMSMGTDSAAFFNRKDAGFGDISNSERTKDLPQCRKTYAVFVYNMTRAVGEMFEDHSHHAEALFNFVDHRDILPNYRAPELLFWGRFVGAGTGVTITSPGCGWTHFPPNTTAAKEYDWENTNPVLSDCLDWKPDGGGQKTAISCKTWYKSDQCPVDGGLSFKIWWFQNYPGLNNTLTYKGRALRNWWELIYDFDKTLKLGGGLYKPDQNVTYTVAGNTSGAEFVTITRTPQPTQNDVIEFKYEMEDGSVTYRHVMPNCFTVDGSESCFYRVFNQSNGGMGLYGVKNWSINHDMRTPFNGSQATLTFNTEFWQATDTSDYHSKMERKYPPQPTLPPTPYPTVPPTPTPSPQACAYNADLSSDDRVDIDDYSLLVGNFLKEGAVIGDIDCSGIVDIDDYSMLIQRFTPL
jgi:hypothetical protein